VVASGRFALPVLAIARVEFRPGITHSEAIEIPKTGGKVKNSTDVLGECLIDGGSQLSRERCQVSDTAAEGGAVAEQAGASGVAEVLDEQLIAMLVDRHAPTACGSAVRVGCCSS
jgi:hypothetical protein